MTYKQHLFKVRIRMSDGQEFEREFGTYTDASTYVRDVRHFKTMFCIEDRSIESEIWINPKQMVSVKVERVL